MLRDIKNNLTVLSCDLEASESTLNGHVHDSMIRKEFKKAQFRSALYLNKLNITTNHLIPSVKSTVPSLRQ